MSQDQLQLSQPEFNIRQYWDILRRRAAFFWCVFVPLAMAGAAATAITPPVYRAEGRFKIPTAAISLNIYDSNNPIADILIAHQPDSPETQLQMMQTPEFMARAMKLAGYQDQSGVEAPMAQVSIVEGTNIISVTVTGGSADDVVNLAKAIISLHSQDTKGESEKGIQDALKFIEDQRGKSARAAEAAQRALDNFTRTNALGLEAFESAAAARERMDLLARIRANEANLRAANSEIAALEKQLTEEPPTVLQKRIEPNAWKDELETRLRSLKLELQDQLLLYGERHEKIQLLRAKIENLQTAFDDEAPMRERSFGVPNTQRDNLKQLLREERTKRRSLAEELNTERSQYARLPRPPANRSYLEVQKNELQRRLTDAQQQYTKFDGQLRDLNMRKIARVDRFTIIQNPTRPGGPIQPRKTTNLIMAVMLALVAAVMITIARELLDDRVHTPGDVGRLTTLPSLAYIPLDDPKDSRKDPRLVGGVPMNSHIMESFRRLRSSIMFAAIDAPIRRILVTSAAKGEGKSHISVNLASVMALDGKRVILVDADMRRPSIHRVLDLENQRGLSNVLVGQLSLQEALQDTELDNLQVICSGPNPPNPPELLGSRAFEDLIDRLEQLADVVIFDSPPCIPVTDPLLIASRVDGVLLVMHVGHSRKAAVRQAEEMLVRARGRILGVVMNRVRARKGDNYYYDYGYYSTYHDAEDNHHNHSGGIGIGGGQSSNGRRAPERQPEREPLAGPLERRLEIHEEGA